MVFYTELKENKRRKFFYKQGNFFILYGGFGKSRCTIALGPQWYVFLGLSLFIGIVLYISYTCEGYTNATPNVKLGFNVSHFLFLFFLFRTGMTDPGVITPSESNSLVEGDSLEKQNYSYCSICQLYRPDGAQHCHQCGVCIEKYDHHCTFMGQCVGKNTVFSFYAMLVCIIICYCFHIYIESPYMLLYSNGVIHLWKKVFSVFFLPPCSTNKDNNK